MYSPEKFEAILKLYDPNLTLRWGQIADCWIVERRCRVSPEVMGFLHGAMRRAVKGLADPAAPKEKKWLLMKACEEGLSASESKRVIVYSPQLDNRVLEELKLTDLQTLGTGFIEQSRNDRAAQAKKDRYTEYDNLSRETSSVVSWALKKKTSEIMHGKSDELFAEAGLAKPRRKQQFAQGGLLDATGVALSRPNQEVSITIATK